MQKACAVILENDRSLETEVFCSTVNAVFDVVGFADVREKTSVCTSRPARHHTRCGRPGAELLQHFPGLPTCALPLQGKTVLQRQIETLNRAGITESWVITGL